MPMLSRFRTPKIAARCVSATALQSAVSGISARIAARTLGVRPQMPSRTVTVTASVPGPMPLMPGSMPLSPRPVTVRVKTSSVPTVSAGIVTTALAVLASSNVTPLVGPEV